MTGGATVELILTIWRPIGFYRCLCPFRQLQAGDILLCCFAHQYRTMLLFTAATVNCFTICLNN